MKQFTFTNKFQLKKQVKDDWNYSMVRLWFYLWFKTYNCHLKPHQSTVFILYIYNNEIEILQSTKCLKNLMTNVKNIGYTESMNCITFSLYAHLNRLKHYKTLLSIIIYFPTNQPDLTFNSPIIQFTDLVNTFYLTACDIVKPC